MRRTLVVLQAPLAAMVLYLDILSLAAALWCRRPQPGLPRHRFAILVPAHDEETLLPRLLESVRALDYPTDLYDVHVVADNCADATAACAATGGAFVYERTDDRLRGKGYALRWLLSRVRDAGRVYDAYVVVDADSVVAPSFLRVMDAHLMRGDQVIQGYYGVLNGQESWPAALRYAGLALFNGLRPRGRDALGLSSGLRGNGMCFAAPVLTRFGWEAFTLAEDAELHLQLVGAGIKVTYAPDAIVLAEMPTSLRLARSQNLRWERGRLHMLRSFGPRLLAHGMRTRNPVLLDAVAEHLIPPLSVLTGAGAVSFALTCLLRARAARRLALAVLCGQVCYVAIGLRLARATPRAYLALLWAPLYVIWKMRIYVHSAFGRRDGDWVRTPRPQKQCRASQCPVDGSAATNHMSHQRQRGALPGASARGKDRRA